VLLITARVPLHIYVVHLFACVSVCCQNVYTNVAISQN